MMTKSFNPMRDISETAIVSVTEMMDLYADGLRASILFAQMQSGKTNAFLLLAGEMLRTGRVENVVIFTGNRETELREQLKTQVKGNVSERSFFDTKYFNYIEKNTDTFDGLSLSDAFHLASEIAQNIKNKITIIWGTELTKKASQISTENTLFIFEESHFAQSLGQTPGKFLTSIGVPANGDQAILKERNNYICSVSATPFSELCDAGNFRQSKKVVRMQPGNDYRGVKWLRDNGKLVGYANWERELANALQTKKNEEKWAIVRVRGDEQFETAERICQNADWIVRKYDQEFSDIENMQELENKPSQASIVILREKCRMGTVVPKNHLAFVFETSTSSKTDTMLQGLLGRACGYHTNDSLLVYLNQELLESRELSKYIEFCDGEEHSVPNNAKNILGTHEVQRKKQSEEDQQTVELSPIIPIHIPRRCISADSTFNDTQSVLRDIIYTLSESESFGIQNFNPDIIKVTLIQELEYVLENNVSINKHKLSFKSYKPTIEKILNVMKYKTPKKIGWSKELQLENACNMSLYYVDKPVPDFDIEVGSYYLCCNLNLTDEQRTEIESGKIKRLPETNGKEIFRYANILETGETEIANGGFCLALKPETATDVTIMLETLRECVLRSKETETMLVNPCKITSIRQPGFEKYTGIYVSLEVYTALLYGGHIYNAIKEEFGALIKYKKSNGRPTKMPKDCIYRLAEISW